MPSKAHRTPSRLSVVVPVCNEAENLPELYRRLTAVLPDLAADYEIVFVNDGSRDNSLEILDKFHFENSRVAVIDLSRNFGHQAALTAGLDHACGEVVVCMDADLQDPPEVLPQLVARWSEGWDVVYAVRRNRKEGVAKRLAYAVFYRLLGRIADVEIPMEAGDFGLMDRKAVAEIRAMRERGRYLRGLRAWVGFSQTGVEYERDRRFAGDVQYTWLKLLRLAVDGVCAFSVLPLRLATILGLMVSALSFVSIVVAFYWKVFTTLAIPGWATTVIAILFLGGVQLLTVGILGEYVARIFEEVKQRPPYIVKRALGVRATTPEVAGRAQDRRSG